MSIHKQGNNNSRLKCCLCKKCGQLEGERALTSDWSLFFYTEYQNENNDVLVWKHGIVHT